MKQRQKIIKTFYTWRQKKNVKKKKQTQQPIDFV